MISKIIGKGIKGLEFEQALGKYNLIIGPNGAGKSARSHALQLAILGYLIQDQAKKAGEIFTTHSAQGKEFSCGIEVDGVTFGRRFRKSGDTVTSSAFHKGKALKRTEEGRALAELGDPRIFDLRAFNELSDAKKIDYLFSLYPPDANLSTIDGDIADLDEEAKGINRKLQGLSLTIEQLTTERSKIEVPAGTLAETTEMIAAREKELAEAQESLKQIEIEEEAARQTAALEEERKKKEITEPPGPLTVAAEKIEMVLNNDLGVPAPTPIDLHDPAKQQERRDAGLTKSDFGIFRIDEIELAFQKVLDTMNKAGCSSCAASLLIKTYLRNIKKEREAA